MADINTNTIFCIMFNPTNHLCYQTTVPFIFLLLQCFLSPLVGCKQTSLFISGKRVCIMCCCVKNIFGKTLKAHFLKIFYEWFYQCIIQCCFRGVDNTYKSTMQSRLVFFLAVDVSYIRVSSLGCATFIWSLTSYKR